MSCHADVRLPLLTCSSPVSPLKRSQPWQIRQQCQCCCISCPTGTPSGSSGRSFPQCLGPGHPDGRRGRGVGCGAEKKRKKKEKKTHRKKASRRGHRTGCLSSGHPSISDLSDKSDLLSEMRSGRRSPFRFVEGVAMPPPSEPKGHRTIKFRATGFCSTRSRRSPPPAIP